MTDMMYCLGHATVYGPYDIADFVTCLLKNLKDSAKTPGGTADSSKFVPLIDIFAEQYSTERVLYSDFKRKANTVDLTVKVEGTDGSEFFSAMATGLNCYTEWVYTGFPTGIQVTVNFSPEVGAPWILGSSRFTSTNTKGTAGLKQMNFGGSAKNTGDSKEASASSQSSVDADLVDATVLSSLASLAVAMRSKPAPASLTALEGDPLLWHCRMACSMCEVFTGRAQELTRECVVVDIYSALLIAATRLLPYSVGLTPEEVALCEEVGTLLDLYKRLFDDTTSNALPKQLPTWSVVERTLDVIKQLAPLIMCENKQLIPLLSILKFARAMW